MSAPGEEKDPNPGQTDLEPMVEIEGVVEKLVYENAENGFVVARLEGAGLRLAGTVQTNSENCDRGKCDMDLRVLPDGPSFRISQDLGAASRGCRLDAGALETAVVAVTGQVVADRRADRTGTLAALGVIGTVALVLGLGWFR